MINVIHILYMIYMYDIIPLGRPRRRWKDNIKMDLQEVGCGGTDWFELAQVGTCEHGNETSGSIKYGEFLGWLRTG
jgi:hypothetical protein